MYSGLALDQLEAHLDTLLGLAYSVSVFTDWKEARRTQLLLKRRVGAAGADDPDELFGARRAAVPRHPIIELAADNCTEQLGLPGPWHERLPHFRLEFTPSVGEELQSEYFVPRARAGEAVALLRGLAPLLSPVLQISELRSVAADELWLSPAYGRDSVGFHFTWINDWPAVRAVLPRLEAALAPLGARPHWGKLFTIEPATVQAAYPRLGDFRRLAAQLDPAMTFRNAFVDRYVFEAPQ
jgi:alditol oxidase